MEAERNVNDGGDLDTSRQTTLDRQEGKRCSSCQSRGRCHNTSISIPDFLYAEQKLGGSAAFACLRAPPGDPLRTEGTAQGQAKARNVRPDGCHSQPGCSPSISHLNMNDREQVDDR